MRWLTVAMVITHCYGCDLDITNNFESFSYKTEFDTDNNVHFKNRIIDSFKTKSPKSFSKTKAPKKSVYHHYHHIHHDHHKYAK